MSRVLRIFTIMVIVVVALFAAVFANALSLEKQRFQSKKHQQQNQRVLFRAPKNNAVYNLTTQDLVGGAGTAVIGGDLYLPYPTSTFSCLALNGWKFTITRAFHSYGAVDEAAGINLNNAAVAGIAYRDVYFFPCPGMDAGSQVREFYRRIPTETYGTLWWDCEVDPSPGCAWSSDPATNCQFLTDLINNATALSIQQGLYSSHWEWLQLFGDANACPIAAQNKLPLWYASYNNQTSFSDFIPFGGYQSNPNMKQFTDTTPFCNVIADQDFYPS